MAVSANFIDDISSLNLKLISVVEIVLDSGSIYFGTKTLTTPACLDYLNDHPKISGSKVDIKEVSSSIASATWSIQDYNGEITTSISEESYINKYVNIYMYFDNPGNTFALDSLLVFKGRVDSISADDSDINFSAREIRFESAMPLFDGKTNLSSAINNSVATIPLKDTSNLLDAGKIKIDDEIISYTAKTSTTLTGAVRGVSSTAAGHDDDADVYEVWESGSINPITLMLRLLLSVNGDGANDATYDTLTSGIGLDPSDIDVASFTAIRDANSFGNYSFLISGGIPNVLKWCETEILAPTITRTITNKEGKLALVQMNQSEFTTSTESITSESIKGKVSLKVNSKEIINIVEIEYNYDEVTGNYKEFYRLTDSESIGLYGITPNSKKRFAFKGMQNDTQANTFAIDYLQRNSTPVPRLSFKTFLEKRLFNPGDDILLSVNNLPNLDKGSRAFTNLVEILSISQSGGIVSFEAAFTRFSNGRPSFISPSRLIGSKTSETVFDLSPSGSAALYALGMNVRLFDSWMGENVVLYTNFEDSLNANWSVGEAIGLEEGSPVITSGFLDLTGSNVTAVGYSGNGNATSIKQLGAIRIKVKPNYSGTPGTDQYFVSIGNPSGLNANVINIYHTSAGLLKAEIFAYNETNIVTISNSWSPTSGTTYEIEFNFDLGNEYIFDTGASRLFVDGTQVSSTNTSIGCIGLNNNRTREVIYINLGSDRTLTKTSNFSIGEFIIFKTIQHTSNYSPSAFPFADYSDVRTISNISGETVTIDSPFDITLDTSRHYLAFADYNQASASQKFWAYICDTDGQFDDESNAYIIKE